MAFEVKVNFYMAAHFDLSFKDLMFEFLTHSDYEYEFEPFSEEKYKLFYYYLVSTKKKTRNLLYCIIYVVYSLVGDHIEYTLQVKPENFKKTCLDLVLNKKFSLVELFL